MLVPSIKGAALAPTVAHIKRLVEDGKLSNSEIEFRLDAEDLDLLDGEVEATLWYPIRCHDRLLEVQRDLVGDGRDEYLAEFARLSAEEMLSAGPYASMVKNSQSFGARAGVVLVKMSELVFNFTRWEYEGENMADFAVHVSDARDFPETARYSAEGFMSYLASVMAGRPVRVTSERVSPDHIVYHGRADERR